MANITPLPTDGLPHKYTIVIVPYTPTREVINVRIELLPGDRIVVRKAAEKLRLVIPSKKTYYQVLRSKLKWGER